MKVKTGHIVTRLYLLVGAVFFMFVLVGIQLMKIQFKEGDRYRSMSKQTTIRKDTIPGDRGNVYSADGSLLATSMYKYEVRMDVYTVSKKLFNDQVDDLADSLAAFQGRSKSEVKARLLKARQNKSRYLFIARNLRYKEYMRLKSFPIFNKGVYKGGFITEQTAVRARPIGGVAARTVGYDDYRGRVGIEGAFHEYLRGENGWRVEQKIAKSQWKPVNDSNEKDPVDGRDVVTTLDVNIQDIAHHSLLNQLTKFEADHGSAVVMEVETGEIKAIVNLEKDNKGSYYESRNFAIYEAHEPGSTFKVASLMVGLEDGKIDTAQVVDTGEGKMKIYNSWVRDSKRGGFGSVSAAKAIELSSNVAIVKLIQEGYENEPQKFVEGLDRLNLNQKTGIKIKGEGTPRYPRTEDKDWNGLSLPWMSWGYGVHITPLQTLTFYNAIANDGVMVKPRLVKEIRYQNKVEKEFEIEVMGDRIASEETLDQVKDILENVVKRGTAKNIYSENFSMAGKTGTCQTEYWTNNTQYVSSFAGFFPVESPKYSCIVVVHKPNKRKGYYGATVAAPVFKEIAQKIYTSTPKVEMYHQENFAFESLRDSYENEDFEAQKPFSAMPDVRGMPFMDAVSLLENMGLNVRYKGSAFGKVKRQSLRKGAKIKKGDQVTITI
ncbi:MAG: penicillin-binding protein [Flavobacteriaceae bacterium]